MFIDHSRGLNVAAVMCSQKVGIGKDWGNDVWKLLVTSKFQNVSGISTSPVVSARIRPAAINLAMDHGHRSHGNGKVAVGTVKKSIEAISFM